ncbi:uncharacterized protein LOC132377519 [Hypanus sabinus]|uniref:uncharacterized protein LOC132377519 n=1 Tax=Hypanus sabinus TaxID=79690 RepID=UPI0028C4C1BF|nr:uncharacterized protein LOC132377519 [Hypanus sabinus]
MSWRTGSLALTPTVCTPCWNSLFPPLSKPSNGAWASFPITPNGSLTMQTMPTPWSSPPHFPSLLRPVRPSAALKGTLPKQRYIPFQVESDASDLALAATLNQAGRPVAFFSRTLQGPEIWHPTVEKEAQAIEEAIRHWRHYLTGKRLTLLTDQRSVAFMFSNQQRGKIKNDKILRWRIELSTYNYDILYWPGRLNEPPDALSRGMCASAQLNRQYALHADLCHPGVTRLYHFVKAQNLPYSLEEIRTMTRDCQVCAECKPHFYRPEKAQLIKATHPFERLSVDFKGSLPSTDCNVYFLNIIDEYSRFPFAIPCPDTTATSVIKALRQLFTLFGYPCYIHSDRGSSFVSDELHQYLLAKGIAASRTTSYNPRGNGQVERENATVWKATLLALRSKGLLVSHWQEVLPKALHSIRSLLCTSTNATPHERLFSFPRKSATGTTLPAWLTSPGPVLLRKHARSNKYSRWSRGFTYFMRTPRGDVTITDRPNVLKQTEHNVAASVPASCRNRANIRALSWGLDHTQFPTDYDFILDGEIVYVAKTYPLLLKTPQHLSCERTTIYLSSKMWQDFQVNSFYEEILPKRFHCQLVNRNEEDNINVYKVTKKITSSGDQPAT